jgi:hypothetical protein
MQQLTRVADRPSTGLRGGSARSTLTLAQATRGESAPVVRPVCPRAPSARTQVANRGGSGRRHGGRLSRRGRVDISTPGRAPNRVGRVCLPPVLRRGRWRARGFSCLCSLSCAARRDFACPRALLPSAAEPVAVCAAQPLPTSCRTPYAAPIARPTPLPRPAASKESARRRCASSPFPRPCPSRVSARPVCNLCSPSTRLIKQWEHRPASTASSAPRPSSRDSMCSRTRPRPRRRLTSRRLRMTHNFNPAGTLRPPGRTTRHRVLMIVRPRSPFCIHSLTRHFVAADDPNDPLVSQTLNADGTPKRPMNAFMIFARKRRPELGAQHAQLRTGEISKLLSKEWSTMTSVRLRRLSHCAAAYTI